MSGPLLLCFDGSESAENAIRSAGRLFPGSEAIVLSVAVPAADAFPLDPVGDLVGRVTGIYREMDEVGSELAQRQAADGCRVAGEAGLQARAMTLEGRAVDSILRAAADCGASLIVVGDPTSGTLAGMLGRVSAGVINGAHTPVLLVPLR